MQTTPATSKGRDIFLFLGSKLLRSKRAQAETQTRMTFFSFFFGLMLSNLLMRQ
jgi:hypothetical protein